MFFRKPLRSRIPFRPRLVLWLALALPMAAVAADDSGFQLGDLLPRALQKNPRLNLTVITEMTREGKAVAAATPEHPVYYLTQDGGLHEEGDPVGGEAPPQKGVLAHVMTSALAANGYQPATREHPPSLLIFYLWGSFNRVEPMPSTDDTVRAQQEGTEGGEEDLADTSDPAVNKNRLERAAIIGGTRFAIELARAIGRGREALRTFRERDAKTEWLVSEVANTNRYFLIASAYDVSAAEQGKKVLLWRTKMSTDAQGLAMNESLLSLVSNAAPYFGREMTEVATLKPRLHAGRVEIGTATVQEYLEDAPARKKAGEKK
jgi:hypothetical protein